ncbi:DUF2336 domain-containing protein [Hyphobacterium marinum]|uniref:DUF2336 domain-containing protein n=1 Tax=Hyphobacterium marinum TaxID=3116574 RepID=A0ABU7M1N4_9PROT|nr:DUF2336 domain-containing protein [Hyphobacterium sp. Y6023]MEE2567734.1 DUF2336 domain-containing protein [Hyphobacterium sp. Y6023]
MGNAAIALAGLARLRDPESHGRLALSITDICIANPLSERAEPLAGEILVTLARKAEEKVRIAMAAALAECDWAPHGIVRFLAFDAPAVARDIILRSLRLTEADLVELTETRSLAHRCLIAERPGISGAVSDALCHRVEPDVMRALINNATASLTETGFTRCAEFAICDSDCGETLSRRHDLPEAIARKLYATVSATVRDQLLDRFNLDPAKIAPVAEFAAEAARADDGDTSAASLIEKLQFAGKLNPGFAVKTLSEGREIVFDHAIAALCGLSVDDWRKVLALSGARTLALACRAARIDRSIYPTVLRAMQKSGRIHDGIEDQAMAGAARIFRDYTPGKAHDSLRRMADSA